MINSRPLTMRRETRYDSDIITSSVHTAGCSTSSRMPITRERQDVCIGHCVSKMADVFVSEFNNIGVSMSPNVKMFLWFVYIELTTPLQLVTLYQITLVKYM